MYNRTLKDKICNKIGSGKAILVIGPRQVGKTTLVKSIIQDKDFLCIDCDGPTIRALLTEPNTEKLGSILGNSKTVFIDEAQRYGFLVSEQQLENRLLYGLYPDVLNNPGQEKEILNQLVNSYLYRDIVACFPFERPQQVNSSAGSSETLMPEQIACCSIRTEANSGLIWQPA